MAKAKAATPKKGAKATSTKATKSPSPEKMTTRSSPRKGTPTAKKAEDASLGTTKTGRITKATPAKKSAGSAKKPASSAKKSTTSTKKPAATKTAFTTKKLATKAAEAAKKLVGAKTTAIKETTPKPRGRPRKDSPEKSATPAVEQPDDRNWTDSPRKKTAAKGKQTKQIKPPDDVQIGGCFPNYQVGADGKVYHFGVADEIWQSIEDEVDPDLKAAVARHRRAIAARGSSKGATKSPTPKAVRSPIKHLAKSATASPKKATSRSPSKSPPKAEMSRPVRNASKSPAKKTSNAAKPAAKAASRSPSKSPAVAARQTRSKSPAKSAPIEQREEAQYLDYTDDLWDGEVPKQSRQKLARAKSPARKVTKTSSRSPSKSPAASTARARSTSPAKQTSKVSKPHAQPAGRRMCKGPANRLTPAELQAVAQGLDYTDDLWDGVEPPHSPVKARLKSPVKATAADRKPSGNNTALASASRSRSRSPAKQTGKDSKSPTKTASRTRSKSPAKSSTAVQRIAAQSLDYTDDDWNGPDGNEVQFSPVRTRSKSPAKTSADTLKRSPSKSPAPSNGRARSKSPAKQAVLNGQRKTSKTSDLASTRSRSKSPTKAVVTSPQRKSSNSGDAVPARSRSRSPAKTAIASPKRTASKSPAPVNRRSRSRSPAKAPDPSAFKDDFIPFDEPEQAKRPVGRPRKASVSPPKPGVFQVPDYDSEDSDFDEDELASPASPPNHRSASPVKRKVSGSTASNASRGSTSSTIRRHSSGTGFGQAFAAPHDTGVRRLSKSEMTKFPKHGNIVSVTNPEFIGNTGKPNNFFAPLPLPEVWHRNMPPRFDFGDTKWSQKYASDQINRDLSKSLNENKEDRRASSGLFSSIANGVKSAFGFAPTEPNNTVYPDPWALPELSEEALAEANRYADRAVGQGSSRKRLHSPENSSGSRKRARAEDLNDDSPYMMSGGLPGLH